MSESGVSKDTFNRLKFEYPSLNSVKKFRTSSTHGAMILNIPGVASHHDQKDVTYRLIIDAREFPSHKPQAFVFTPSDSEIKHCNVYHARPYSIWPNRLLCAVCDGVSSEMWNSYEGDELYLFGLWLNQLSQVLNNPNPDDSAREV
jgi:hypothetical protein